jgi:hypothetical protein
MVDEGSRSPAEKKAAGEKAVAEGAAPPKRKVASRRVTAKGGGRTASTASKVGGHGKDEPGDFASRRYTAPSPHQKPPSPAWVPVVMFGLIIVGALVIILNYVGLLGGVSNIKLVIGLALILAGIITATQYR